MKNRRGILKIITVIVISTIIFSVSKVFANTDFSNLIREAEYSEEYKNWLNLSDEERMETLEPIKYDIIPYQSNEKYLKSMNNIFKARTLLRNSLDTRYSLQDIIPENMLIRNQMQTNTCWSFATIGSLETNLALQDKLHGNDVKVYDFSERHMTYSALRNPFLDGEINEYGFSKNIADGGNVIMSQAYLTNGLGAINEEDMPFENNNDDIDISEIQNKEVQTTVLDTTLFTTPTTNEERLELIEEIKQYISNYGGLYASVYGDTFMNDTYNNATGAIYCNDAEETPTDHAVTIIGWDDDYDVSNFNENKRPSSNGAWIAKNSWGESQQESLTEIKNLLYTSNEEMFNQSGIYSSEDIPTEFIEYYLESLYGEEKVTIDGDTINVEIGDKGFVYISYEDVNIYNTLYGIKNAINEKDNHKIYQLDPLGATGAITYNDTQDLYLVNTFKRDTTVQEKLDKISIATYQGFECEVYVNPNGKGKSKEELQKVELKDGDSTVIEPFYNTIEFAEPIDLTGEYFTVAVKVKTNETTKLITIESKLFEQTATVNAEESFIGTETTMAMNQWIDLGVGVNGFSGNLCIKAFTTDTALNEISVTTNPTKTVYKEGENFDKTGLKVMANYSDGTSKEITDYTITDGNNLKLGQTSVTISYSEGSITKTATVAITVEENLEEEPEEKPGEEPEEPEEEPGENPSEERNPTPSNFSSADGKITDTEHYIYTNDSGEDYSIIKIRISNIKMGDTEDDYTYYYYLSSIQGETNIDDSLWKRVDIYNNNNGTITLEININTLDMKTYEELFESDNLFIYIKEVAKIDQKEAETINTLPLTKISEDKIYINGELSDGTDEERPNNNQDNNQNEVDDTTAPGILPQTGTLPIILLIMGLIIIGVISYNRFKNIDK